MASVVFIDRSNGKVLGQSDVYMANMVALYGNGCVFALSVDDKLWEQIYVKFEVAKDVKYTIWGDFGEIRFDNYSVVILAPSELITFGYFVVSKGCAFGLSDRRGLRSVFVGKPCECEKLKKIVDVAKDTFIRLRK